MSRARKLIDDCFVHDDQRIRHDDVLAMLADRLRPVTGTQTVPLIESAGRIAATDIVAREAIPRSDNAAVDGFAFDYGSYRQRAGRLTNAGTLAAGDDRSDAVADGACVHIFTGAAMPEGTDTVAMEEDCLVDEDGTIMVPPGLKQGANRRRRGEDFMPGTAIVSEGAFLRAQDLAALAAHGHGKVDVRTKLRIGILSTGNEIIEPGQRARPNQVHDANRPLLAALASGPATELIDLGHVMDDAPAIETRIADAAGHVDLLITSGGASRGGQDHMLDILDRLGKRHVWQIAVKPGRPMMFGQIGDTVLIGLPGNPVAVMVCFALYAMPVIGHLAGGHWQSPVGVMLPAAFEITRKKAGRREFARGWTAPDAASGMVRAHKFERDGSGLICGLQAASGLIELPEDLSGVGHGDMVRFLPFSELLLPRG